MPGNGLVRWRELAMTMRGKAGDADALVMKPTGLPSYFNPSLGMAVKGMWSTIFTQAVIEALEQDDPEPATEPEAA